MTPILSIERLSAGYRGRLVLRDVSFTLNTGEVIAVVGESGSGKSTLLGALSGRVASESGSVTYSNASGESIEVVGLPQPELTRLWRSEWGFVTQNPRDGLRLEVSAGANIAERLMERGERNYAHVRREATRWLDAVEIDAERVDDRPSKFSGGMQQRLQIARSLAVSPRLVFFDEPTGGLDVSVQARLLDLIRHLVADLGLSALLVTHDLAVARLLAHRIVVLHRGEVVESGLADQVLDDPHHAYTQLLVSSVLTA